MCQRSWWLVILQHISHYHSNACVVCFTLYTRCPNAFNCDIDGNACKISSSMPKVSLDSHVVKYEKGKKHFGNFKYINIFSSGSLKSSRIGTFLRSWPTTVYQVSFQSKDNFQLSQSQLDFYSRRVWRNGTKSMQYIPHLRQNWKNRKKWTF